ncbi:MAG: SMC-Scp complex subunit ScpB [Ignavibacteriales bacterium]|nr:SMC-Scp complex subunit ScpB [Ignavibacteriales bacterium]
MESLIFASEEPLFGKQLLAITNQSYAASETVSLTLKDIVTIIEELNQEYETQRRAFRIIEIAGGYQFATRPQYSRWLGELFKEKIKRRLSQAALETLALIAYKQPMTKPEIESVRGVNADYVISSLLDRGLITIVGRAASLGRPLLYGTTDLFLHHFGLNSLSDLPRLREIEELLKESQLATPIVEAQSGENISDSQQVVTIEKEEQPLTETLISG